MSSEVFNLEAYLKRINYEGPTDVSYETLEGLHVAHTMNVPFENLDVVLGRPILLDRESLFNKIVVNNRGGYCFEMNTFFKYVLEALGFNVTILLTYRTRERQEFAARTHQLLLVEIDGQQYIADVGFGMNGLTAPLRLEVGVDQQQFTHTYRLQYDEEFGYILQNKMGDEYRTMFAFKLDPCNLADCTMSNHYMATYPDSLYNLNFSLDISRYHSISNYLNEPSWITDTYFIKYYRANVRETRAMHNQIFCGRKIPHVSWRQTSHVSLGLCPQFLRPACPRGGCQSCSFAGSKCPYGKIQPDYPAHFVKDGS